MVGLLLNVLTACGGKPEEKFLPAGSDTKPDATGQPQNIKQGTTPGGG